MTGEDGAERVFVSGERVPPATPFWEGYKRPPQMTADLIAALSEVLYARPEQRVGQLLANLTSDGDLFTIYDEGLLAALRELTDIGSTEGDDRG